MTKQQEKEICLSILIKHGKKIPLDYINRYILKYPDANFNTIYNVRHGKTFNLEILKKLFQVCDLDIGNAIPTLAAA